MQILEPYDGKVLRFRVFRFHHGISLAEIARAAGVSVQRINRLELLEQPVTPYSRMLLTCGLEKAIEQRHAGSVHILKDYHMQRRRLFDIITEADE